MSAPKWTPAQRAAIEDRGGTLLVSAAAGSGKTAVLVERAVRLITDAAHPVAADRLLIVTFTRAAAEELRGRIAVRLAAEAAAHPESAYLRRQRLLLGRANICTIDEFCMQLLKRYFAELGLPPDFELADDAKAYTLRQNALSAVLEELYEDADFCAFASLYGGAAAASAAAAVLGLYDFSRTLPHPSGAAKHLRSLRKRTAAGPNGMGPYIAGKRRAGRAQRTAPAGCGEGHRRAGAGACQLCTGAGQRRGVFRGAAGIHRRGPVGQCGCLYSRIQAACVQGCARISKPGNECGEGAARRRQGRCGAFEKRCVPVHGGRI
ncbi:MAG: UvrD-helicase domain-containing protein [Ruthenibacterium lactatiformans]